MPFVTPSVLTNTDFDVSVLDKFLQASSFESQQSYHELVSSDHTSFRHARVEHDVAQYCGNTPPDLEWNQYRRAAQRAPSIVPTKQRRTTQGPPSKCGYVSHAVNLRDY